MAVWAIADLHLSFGVPNKKMDIFGEKWRDHPEKIAQHWSAKVAEDDLVLVAGDISWGKHADDVAPDLEWIHALPGTKVFIKGNHDYWWSSLQKMNAFLPPSIKVIQNNALLWNDIAIGGCRLWDTKEYSFPNSIFEGLSTDEGKKKAALNPAPPMSKKELEQQERIYDRDLNRLELSLKALDQKARKRVVMTHYPPLNIELQDSRASKLLEQYKVDICVFGHIHDVKSELKLFGKKNGVTYLLTCCDYLQFDPLKLLD